MAHSRFKWLPAALAALLILVPAAQAGWMDKLESLGEESGVLKEGEESGILTDTTSAALTNDEMVAGLKQALQVGLDNAVSFLGQPGGYLNHEAVRIPMPEHMQTAAKVARTMGKEQLVNDFVASMNRAAEKAVPEALDVFTGAVKKMSISDAKKILNGPDNAATEYFRKNTSGELTDRFMPIVEKATNSIGVTRKYKDMTEGLGPATAMLDMQAADLDAYVTDEALDGLFYMVAQEEKKIRENPTARTTELLKKVFGSIGK